MTGGLSPAALDVHRQTGLRLAAAKGDATAQGELARLRAHDERLRAIKVQGWIQRRLIKIEHRIQMEEITAQSVAFRTTLERTRRIEEESTLKLTRSRVTHPGAGGPPPAVMRQFRRQTIEPHLASVPLAGNALRYWQHIGSLLQQHAIAVRWTALPGTNAYAWATLREIELAPIVTPESYVIALHEIAHVLNPCDPAAHVRVPTTETKTACVQCELTAWRTAILLALDGWTRQMHFELTDSLLTYRRYATPGPELTEVEQLAAPGGYNLARLLRAKREAGIQ